MTFILIISIILLLILLFICIILEAIKLITNKKNFKKLHIKWFGFEFSIAM